VQGILPAVKLGEKLAFQIEPLRDFIFPVEVFEHVAVDDGFAVGLAESLDHPMKTPEMLPQQQPGWIEVLLGQLTESGRRNIRQAQAHIDRFAVLQRNGGARACIRLAFELVAVPFPEAQKKGLDVLAGAQGVDGEVRARAVVFAAQTMASVVSMREAMEAAFCRAVRVTLVGSITPAFTRSSYCSVER
jgi:hypothetical protein